MISDTVQTDTWSMKVPSGWQEEKQENGSRYFESSDGEKGFYIATWNRGKDLADSPAITVESYYKTSAKSLNRMEGYSWRVIDR